MFEFGCIFFFFFLGGEAIAISVICGKEHALATLSLYFEEHVNYSLLNLLANTLMSCKRCPAPMHTYVFPVLCMQRRDNLASPTFNDQIVLPYFCFKLIGDKLKELGETTYILLKQRNPNSD